MEENKKNTSENHNKGNNTKLTPKILKLTFQEPQAKTQKKKTKIKKFPKSEFYPQDQIEETE